MAVVKVNFVKRDKKEKARAKATIRYIEHRPGKDGARITRALFGSDGVMGRQEAYRMIDEAEKGSIFFRIIIAPDPNGEDKRRDLDMREVTLHTMSILVEKMRKPLQWVAAQHTDDTQHRHVHIVAVVPGRLNKQDLELLRREATALCLEQRKELDLYWQKKEREREEAGWERGY